MGLFIDEPPVVRRPPVDALAVVSLIVVATGFLNIVGFLIGPVLAHVALGRLRGTPNRGRRLAVAALWLSYTALAVGILALLVVLVMSYGSLPRPDFS